MACQATPRTLDRYLKVRTVPLIVRQLLARPRGAVDCDTFSTPQRRRQPDDRRWFLMRSGHERLRNVHGRSIEDLPFRIQHL